MRAYITYLIKRKSVPKRSAISFVLKGKTYIFHNVYLPTWARPASTSLVDDDTAEVTFPRERHLQLICLFMFVSVMGRISVFLCYIGREPRHPLWNVEIVWPTSQPLAVLHLVASFEEVSVLFAAESVPLLSYAMLAAMFSYACKIASVVEGAVRSGERSGGISAPTRRMCRLLWQ